MATHNTPAIHDSTTAERDRWFDAAFFENAQRRDGDISSSSLLLEIDIRIAFRAGAWISVIVLSAAAVEAQYRHVFTGDYEAKAKELYRANADLEWLRVLRNEILHVDPPGARSQIWKVAGADFRNCQAALEFEARRAVTVMFRSIYSRRGT